MTSSTAEPVFTKSHNYRLWQSGALGCKLRAWRSVDEWRESGFAGLVVLRLVEGGGPCRYNLSPEDVPRVVDEWLSTGITLSQIMVNEAAPDDDVILQGEYLNDVFTLKGSACWSYFHYSRARQQMRDALKEAPETAVNLRSDLLLRLAMTPASHEDWQGLLGRYPGHVLEVSVYDRCLGDVPGRNALVWEVRRY